MILDGLRPPGAADRDRELYKDWLHLNLFDPASGVVGLVNVALHGAPEDPRARAVGTALAHLPGEGWVGNAEVAALQAVDVSETHVGLRGVGIGLVRRSNAVLASVRLSEHGLTLDLQAEVAQRPISAPWRLALGHGWIAWHAVPRLTVRGSARVAGRPLDLGRAAAYHDHNWGRWRWGDDLGWEWGCFLGDEDSTIVLSRTTDREHTRRNAPLLTLHHAGRRRTFSGASVSVDYGGQVAAPPRRLPGALAVLHGDRARPRLPAQVCIVADDGRDHVALTFTPRAAAQLIAAEVHCRGYGFIHELPGSFSVRGEVAGRAIEFGGLGIYEHVD
jgi:hypothetical protein